MAWGTTSITASRHSTAPDVEPGVLSTSALPLGARHAPRQAPERVHQAHRLGQAGGLPIEHDPGALGGEVPGAEAGAAGGDDDPGEPGGHLDDGLADRLTPVGDRPVLDHLEALGGEPVDEGPARPVVTGAGDDAVGGGEDLGLEAGGRGRGGGVVGHDRESARAQGRSGTRRRSRYMPSVPAACGSSRAPRPSGIHGSPGGASASTSGRCGRDPLVDGGRLRRGDGADAVDDLTARTHEVERRGQQAHLQLGQVPDVVGADAPPGVGPTAQRTEAGARRVEQDLVERTGAERRGGSVGRHGHEVIGSQLERGRVADDQPDPAGAGVGRHHGGPLAGHEGRLAAGRGAQVEHPLPGGRTDGGGHPLGAEVLDVAVVAHRHRGGPVHLLERGDGDLVPEVGGEAAHDPVGLAETHAVAGPLHREGARHLAEHRVAEALELPGGRLDGGPDRGVRRGVEECQLERAEPQPRPGGGVDARGVGQEAVDQPVAGALHAGGAVDQLGDEGAVAIRQPAAFEHRREGEVGVGAAGVDAHEGLDRQLTGGHARGVAHGPSRSPGSGRLPLRQAVASWRLLPSGWTSTRRSAPSPVATTTSSRVPGEPTRAPRGPRRPGRPSRPSAACPGRWSRRRRGARGDRAPRRARDQSISSSVGSILAAWVGSPACGVGVARPAVSDSTTMRLPISTRRPRRDVEGVVGGDVGLLHRVHPTGVEPLGDLHEAHARGASPASRARSTGAAPRHRGSREKCRLTIGTASSTRRGMMRP